MYTPNAFTLNDQKEIESLIAAHPFATLISDQLITHLPINRLNDGQLYGHLAINNPHAQVKNGSALTAIFHGPHAYISPNYYHSEFNVPTWNYAVVHCHGTISFIDDEDATWDCFKQMVQIYEGDNGWQLPDEDAFKALSKAIRFFNIENPQFEAKAKFNQNKSEEDINSVIAALMNKNEVAYNYMKHINSL